MVKYAKGSRPLYLVDKKRQDAFEADKLAEEYVDKNSLYKCKYDKNNITYYPIKDALIEIYKNRCAYCETQINRTSTSIEHYRPKKSDHYTGDFHRLYYFLAYSWSNLLPICNMCNSKKSNRFDIANRRVIFNGESLEELQYITKKYNDIEKPMFIHPEFDDYKDMFRFNKYGKIVVYSQILDSHRMEYTIKHSDLNDSALMKRRAKVLNDFVKMKNRLLNLYNVGKKHKEEFNTFITNAKIEIKDFFNDDAETENEFIAVRKYIVKEINLFLLCLDKIFIKYFKAFLNRYVQTLEVYNN